MGPSKPSGRRDKARAWLFVAGFVLATVVVLQTALTLTSLNGHDFADAKRHGQATVLSCERRGPVGMTFGYWDDCLVSIRWDGGGYSPDRRRPERPHLFHATDIGKTIEIGDNGRSRGGKILYSRAGFPPQPVLLTLGIILFIAGAVPAFLIVAAIWTTLKDAVRSGIRRLRA